MDAPKASQQQSESEKLHFLDYWRIIRIRKVVILLVWLLVVVTTTAITYLMPESYSSTVRIAVEKDSPDIAPLIGYQSQQQHDPYFILTEFQKIESKSVLYPVIGKLDLCREWMERAGRTTPLETNEVYEILKKQVDVSQSRNTSLIEIQVYSRDKEEAALLANEIALSYRDSRERLLAQRSERGIETLEEQLIEANAEVRKAQDAVSAERDKYNITDILPEARGVTSTEPEEVRRLTQERTLTQAQYVEMKSVYDELQQLRDQPEKLVRAISVAFPDSTGELPRLISERAQTEQQLARMAAELGPEHQTFQNMQALEKKIEEQINQHVDGLLVGLQIRVETIKTKLDELEKEINKAKKRDVEMARHYQAYQEAKQKLENLKKIRDAILLRVNQERVDAALPKSAIVEITDHAEPNDEPVLPNVPLNLALGIVVGLILGVGLAFFIEYLDTSVKTIDDVERALQAPVVGVIPQNVGSLLEEGPENPHAEAYRVLRTNILFSRKSDSMRTLTVVSGGAGEGKSTTIFNLATVFAQTGDRVLLVDSDLRRPSLHKIINVSNTVGLTTVLMKQGTMEEAIQTTSLPTMDFMASGKLPSSSMGILNSNHMREFVKEVKSRYDFVFFDSPPIMGVSDASILASEVDMSLLVIQHRKYPQAMTVRAKQMVEKVGGTLLGVVLNNINISQDSYYYYYSGYYYDYYSKHQDEDTADSEKKNGKVKKQAGTKKEKAESQSETGGRQGGIKPKY